MLHVALSDLPTIEPAIDTLAKDYSNGFDETWWAARGYIVRLRLRYDYGEVVVAPTEDNPHSELPDFRRFWEPKERKRRKRRNQNR